MDCKEFNTGVIDYLWFLHVLDVSIAHGLGYVRANHKWIRWEFNRKLQRMTPEQWEQAAKDYKEHIKRCKNELQSNTSGESGNKKE